VSGFFRSKKPPIVVGFRLKNVVDKQIYGLFLYKNFYHTMRQGRKSAAQTPAPPKERIKGSRVNPKGSASSKASGKSIKLSPSIVENLEEKKDAFNKTHKDKVNTATLKAVFRRGAGAYSSSHRPTITGGKPNSRTAWAYARVNKFLEKKGGKPVKKAYVQDDDLLAKGGQTKEDYAEYKTSVVAIINSQGEILILQRGSTAPWMPNKWSLVGGVVDEGENPKEAVIREAKEEVNLTLNNVEYQYEIKTNDAGLIYYYISILPKIDDLKLDWENQNYTWVNKINYNKYDYVPYVKEFIENIIYPTGRALSSIEKIRGQTKTLLAPNGKPSNLTPEQYNLVRTPEFKAWFGDWENDKENSGKISGITKEPTIWYHSTKSNFLIKKGENIFKNPPFYFALSRDVAENIVTIQHEQTKGKIITKPFFVKYKNTFDISKFDILSDKKLTSLVKKLIAAKSEKEIKSFNLRIGLPKFQINTWVITENYEVQNWIKSKKYDSFFVYEDGHKNLAVFLPEQIKLADGSNVTFDASNPDIRYAKGGLVKTIEQKDSTKFVIKDKTKIVGEALLMKYTHIAEALDLEPNADAYMQKAKYLKEHKYRTCEEGWYLDFIEVKSEYRNKGYAKRLMNSIVNWSKQNDVNVIFINAMPYDDIEGEKSGLSLKNLVSFYEKFGFERISKHYLALDLEKRYEWYEEGGQTQTLLAPNGKPSNLTPEQYNLVRTPEFKAWFGDWENDPKNASKVVDENGEPLVVYHGTNNDFTIFKLEKPTTAAYGQGFYFTNDKKFASNYARGQNGKILSLFLKIKNVFEIYEDELPSGYEKYSEMLNNKGLSRDFTNKLVSNGYNGVYAKNRYNEDELVVFNSNQIKLADGSNITFDMNNPDIRYEQGGKISDMKKNLGSTGGYLVGKRHSEGGIKAINKSTEQPIEMEGGEVVITRNAVSDDTKREFNGKMMTNREILSAINVSGGGVSFADGGEIKECNCTGRHYKYGGNLMRDYEIVESMKAEYPADFKKGVNEEMDEHEDTFKLLIKRKLSPKQAAERVVAEHLSKKPEYYDNYEKGGFIDIMGRKIMDYKTFMDRGIAVISPYHGESEKYYKVMHPSLKRLVYAKGGNIRRAVISPLLAYKNFVYMTYNINFTDLPNTIKNALLQGEQSKVDNYIK
jgi:8-oxo-dGTP pyrophosphatase MutT (NUDIX family)/ribosomal protein S18 acetylase RimI-like enzyme